MAKKQTDPAIKAIVMVVIVIGGVALAVIVAAIIIMFFALGPLQSSSTGGSGSANNTTEQNNAIQAQAIAQQNPSICDQIKGETSVSMPLPGGNKLQTYDEVTSKQRCRAQATAGQPYVY